MSTAAVKGATTASACGAHSPSPKSSVAASIGASAELEEVGEGGEENMGMEARIGRERQRYSSSGARLIAGCIPVREMVSTGADAGATADSGSPVSASSSLSRLSGGGGGGRGHVSDYEVLMITSRNSKSHESLIFPKGGWEEDETSENAAIRETWEEAGVVGEIERQLGSFSFQSKRAKTKGYADGACVCWVYVMKVLKVKDDWPEMGNRVRRWLSFDEAITKCRHPWMQSALEEWRKQLHGETNARGDANAVMATATTTTDGSPA